jgi:hypothetical protein
MKVTEIIKMIIYSTVHAIGATVIIFILIVIVGLLFLGGM